VSAAHLSESARRLGLGEHLLLSKGEERSGGRGKRALLANTLEALIAAIHQDGGMEAARRFVVNCILKPLRPEQAEEPPAVHNFKGALQELAQSLKLPAPKYVLVGEQGPEHSKHFVVEARINAELAARAEGLSKKSAGQNAAQSLLERLSQSWSTVRM
jgi:ribonuclease-3